MADNPKLQQLIDEAKAHRQPRLTAFQNRLEEVLSKELCEMLGITFGFSTPGDIPIATLTVKHAIWEIHPRDDGGWLIAINGRFGSPGLDGFTTKDQFLLLLDQA
jgi:hypothetical protein